MAASDSAPDTQPAVRRTLAALVHEINNVITPLALETEALLAGEPELSERMRAYVESINRGLGAIADAVRASDGERRAVPPDGAAPMPPPAPMHQHPLRILLVDDDPFVLDSLSTVLIGEGHFVVRSSAGPAAVVAVRDALTNHAPFQVVITDFAMPGMDGRTTARAIKAASPGTQVILLTGWGRRRADREVDAEIDFVLTKPPQLAELHEALAYCSSSLKWDALSGEGPGAGRITR